MNFILPLPKLTLFRSNLANNSNIRLRDLLLKPVITPRLFPCGGIGIGKSRAFVTLRSEPCWTMRRVSSRHMLGFDMPAVSLCWQSSEFKAIMILTFFLWVSASALTRALHQPPRFCLPKTSARVFFVNKPESTTESLGLQVGYQSGFWDKTRLPHCHISPLFWLMIHVPLKHDSITPLLTRVKICSKLTK